MWQPSKVYLVSPMESTQTRRNALFNIAGESLWGLKANLVVPSVILAVLLYQYGASPELIGVISAIEISMQLIPQLLGGYIFHTRARRKVRLVVWHYIVMLPFTLLMGILTFFADRVDPGVYRVGMLICFAGYISAMGVVSAAWVEFFLGTIYHAAIRGTVAGLSSFGASLAGTVGALFAGWWIGTIAGVQAYAWLYVFSWLLGMVSITTFLFIKDPGEADAPEETRPSLAELTASLRCSLGSANFRNYLVGRLLSVCAFSLIPFIAIYYTSTAGGGIAKDYVVASFSAYTIANALGALALGRLGDRHGHRWGVLFGAGMQAVTLTTAVLLAGPAGCILTYVGAGLANSCGFVSHSNLVMEMCPPENKNRVAHISIANLVIGLPAAAAPILAGWAAGNWNIPTLFMACAGISLAALVWLGARFKEPRAV
jgi:MFS family permease